MRNRFLAIDLGAESGRALLATLGPDNINVQVLHRFPTQGLEILNSRQWDALRIYEEIVVGIGEAVRVAGDSLAGISIDTWGVDFGLLARDGTLLGNPVMYRDARNEGMAEAAAAVIPPEELYQRTGMAVLPFNTIYQLLSLVKAQSPVLPVADKMLFMGNLLAYWLTGVAACEHTIASTSGMLRAGTREWDRELLARLGIPEKILLSVKPSETVLGPLAPAVRKATGASEDVPFILGAIHDTAAAVVAAPVTDGGSWAYLSSGTWSLLGVENDAPILTEEVRAANYTHEAGVGGKIRFLKNIIGLWLLQECRRAWVKDAGGKEDGLGYGDLVQEAEAAEPLRSLIDAEDPRLLAPKDMPEMIRTLCREGGEPIPETRGQMVRCALESLALCYRRNLLKLNSILGRNIDRLHIIGGGTQNELLNQMTADACGITVKTGPVEATAIGNVAVQAIAVGQLKDLAEARALIARSFPIDTYEPQDTTRWAAAEARLFGG